MVSECDVLIADGRIDQWAQLNVDMLRYRAHFRRALYSALVSLIVHFIGDECAATQDEPSANEAWTYSP